MAAWSANRLDVFGRGARQTMLLRPYNRAKCTHGAVAREVDPLNILERGAATSAGRRPGMADGWATTPGADC